MSRAPISDLYEALHLLKGGDVLFSEHLPEGAVRWRFYSAAIDCDLDLVRCLKRGGPVLEPSGGRLIGLQDQLFPGAMSASQTWAWVEGGVQ